MNILSQYVLQVGIFLILAMALEGLLPSGSSKKYGKLVLGLLFVLVLIKPIIGWIEQGVPLETLTLADLEEPPANPYEKQAAAMIEEGCEEALMEQGLPAALRGRYKMIEVKMGEPIRVTLSREKQTGDLTINSLDLGQIGASKAEKETLRQALSAYWGIEEENLEMRLR